MSLSRRELLQGAIVGAGIAALPRSAHASTARPRALVQLHLHGGIDAIFTTDPKVRSDVDPRVDLIYGEHEIVQAGSLRLGPHFAGLKNHAPRFAIVNGVRCSTVAHETGTRLIRQARRTYVAGAPSLCTLVGGLHEEERPLDEVRITLNGIDDDAMRGASPSTLLWNYASSPSLWQDLHRLGVDRARRDVLARALASQRNGEPGPVERASIDTFGRLLARMPDESPPTTFPTAKAGLGEGSRFSQGGWQLLWNTLPTIGWLLRNRLTSSIYIDVSLAWDTHFDNNSDQQFYTTTFAPFFAELLSMLDSTHTRDGASLSTETGVVCSSELGRFPFLNRFFGKDHLPEMPMIVVGPGIRPGVYGETNKLMISTPIARATGRAGAGPSIAPTLDDMGTTILRWFGARDPLALGYVGEPLDFLFA